MAADVVVYASAPRNVDAVDDVAAFPILRDRSRTLLPTPAVARRAQRVVRDHGCDTVVFGASAPLGLLAPQLRAAGVTRRVAWGRSTSTTSRDDPICAVQW